MSNSLSGNYKGTNYPRRPFTKEEITKLIAYWNGHTKEEIEERFQRPFHVLNAIAKEIRQAGIKMEKKGNQKWGLQSLIKQVVSEL